MALIVHTTKKFTKHSVVKLLKLHLAINDSMKPQPMKIVIEDLIGGGSRGIVDDVMNNFSLPFYTKIT